MSLGPALLRFAARGLNDSPRDVGLLAPSATDCAADDQTIPVAITDGPPSDTSQGSPPPGNGGAINVGGLFNIGSYESGFGKRCNGATPTTASPSGPEITALVVAQNNDSDAEPDPENPPPPSGGGAADFDPNDYLNYFPPRDVAGQGSHILDLLARALPSRDDISSGKYQKLNRDLNPAFAKELD
ncbi:hypothetical protein DL96DRAFT_1643909 [Flagelloscypha sp. PMI_526]|nr:hypothetical protein DL96DRAFT_1643909 [Flagelloscypha sp. PMI_526]